MVKTHKVVRMVLRQSKQNMPVGFVLLVLLIVDGAHFVADDACHLMHEVDVPSCGQANRLRKEGGLLCIVPWHPHAMQALCKCRHAFRKAERTSRQAEFNRASHFDVTL